MPSRKNATTSAKNQPGASTHRGRPSSNPPPAHDAVLELVAADINPGYGVRTVQANVPAGALYWQVIRVYHLSPDENGRRHVVFVDPLDESGARDRNPNLRLFWTWEGRTPDQRADPKIFEKPDSEPAGNVDLYLGQKTAVWIEGDGLPSDRVENLHSNHPDETSPSGVTGNTIGHHSFHVVFQRTRKPAAGDPDPGEPAVDVVVPDPPAAPTPFRFEAWPSEHRTVTQWFGANPADYAQWNLPGHEGIDIVAPRGSGVFSVAPGVVKMVQPVETTHPYGIHVRVSHVDGYETIYAHLLKAEVTEGQAVAAGARLGSADDTGNSHGHHLHLTLKKAGAVFGGYPNNIIDPTPFLAALLDKNEDNAAYVRDVVADGTRMQPGARFVQRWTLKNLGSTRWGPGYTLAFVGGDAIGAPGSVSVPPAEPGEMVDIPVSMVAPGAVGHYRGVWRMRNADGVNFGQQVWIDIEVAAAVIASPPPLPAGNAGQVSARDKLGIDANAPISTTTGAIAARIANPDVIAATGVGWVRLNFIRGPWQGPTDATHHQGRTWQETYAQIIQGFRSAGLRVYGLIGHETIGGNIDDRFRNAPGFAANDDWVRAYADTFADVVRMFHNDVEAFESFNEPDDWHGQQRNWIHPEWFAVILQAIRDRVRQEAELRDVTIVSGPVQGLHNTNNISAGAGYLDSTLAAGERFFGWGTTKPMPFDGIGYHIYVAQDPNQPDSAAADLYQSYMQQMRAVLQRHPGAFKPIYISEFGWQSSIGEQKQSARLQIGMRELLKDPNVALGVWFCTEDFGETWGLYPQGALSASNRKPAFEALRTLGHSGALVTVPQGVAGLAVATPELLDGAIALELAPAAIASASPAAAGGFYSHLLTLVDTLIAGAAAHPETALRLVPILAGLDLVYRQYESQQATSSSDMTDATSAALEQITELLAGVACQ